MDRTNDRNRSSTKGLPLLRRIVEAHRVCWEVWPEQHVLDGKELVQVGYHLQLVGVHHHPKRTPRPGCEECLAVYDDLRAIAQWITPKHETSSQYQVQIFDSKLRYAGNRGYREEVSLSLKILHRGKLNAPLDACEKDCLAFMEHRLAEIGAKKHRWD